MKKKHQFIEDWLAKQYYGCVLSADKDPNPWITYFPRDKKLPRYTYYYKQKIYRDDTNEVDYTPAQFVRYIKRIENLIAFW